MLEQQQAGDRADAQLPGQVAVGFAVELGQAAAAGQLAGGLFEGGGERFARTAPIRPDVDQQWQIAFDLAGVAGFGEFERGAQQHVLFAAAAFRRVAQALGGQAVEAVAVGAGDYQWFGHVNSLRFLGLLCSPSRHKAAPKGVRVPS